MILDMGKINDILKYGTAAFIVLGAMLPLSAKKISDSQKHKQVRSMEFADWNFAPSIYYGNLHPKYSGAKSKLLVFDYSFHEDKSDTKRLCWIRTENVVLEQWRSERMKAQHEALSPVVSEEVYQATDRLVDLHYSGYKEEFEYIQDGINECLSYSLERSRGKMAPAIEELAAQNRIICDNIAYIRKTGPGYEMENASRQEGYEKALEDMRSVFKASLFLVQTTIKIYPPL